MFMTNQRYDQEKRNEVSINSSSRQVCTNTTWETNNHGSSLLRKDLGAENTT